MKFLKLALVSLVVLYLGFVGAVFFFMHRPPEQFAAAIAKLPGPAFMLVPFETLWFRARAGTVRAGDMAPDFRLTTLDHKSEVTLASFRGVRPVVLIFGSYT